MRIISGKFKGKKLLLPSDRNTRPLKDIVKESIFNLLEHSNKFKLSLSNSSILDLFSGCGSFGIECISRGSKNVYFFENYLKALEVLKKNLLKLDHDQNYKIFESDCFTFFNSNKIINEKFDLIFIDPPYKELRINELIEKIIERRILGKKGLFVIHRHKKDKLPITEKINILDVRAYGISKVYIAN
tara:strand:+ start:1284 stop:1844 length:561 start_codon:yes stop_codon:yes gene_type:complete